ncbi:hypothetical protein DL95DRAFT_396402, partial [Leptodontidium sp. 2 PMI_412]
MTRQSSAVDGRVKVILTPMPAISGSGASAVKPPDDWPPESVEAIEGAMDYDGK